MTAALKELLADERIWTIAARVAVHDGESLHYAVTDEGHVEISLITLRHAVPIRAILRGGADDGNGLWSIPSVGTEVMVSFDDGEFEGDAYAVSAHGEKPDGVPLDPDKVFLIGPTVEVRSVDGAAQSLAFQEKLNALEDKVNSLIAKYNAHTHILAIVGTTGTAAVTATTETTIASSTGTDVLKGE
jgi:hypothetical protein